MIEKTNYSIILVDGACNLCNGWVKFVSKRDKKQRFRYASLQSSYSKEKLKKHNFHNSELTTLVYVVGNKLYTKSDAVLKILNNLSTLYKMSAVFYIFPKKLRNGLYDFVGRKRYIWFGKMDKCEIPSKVNKTMFLDKEEAIYK